MKKPIYLFFALLMISACTSPTSEQHVASKSTPEANGVSSSAILKFIEAAEKERPDDIHSIILLRNGEVLAEGWWEPYNPNTPHELFSLSKSFASTAVGLAQAEGLLSIYDPVISFFPDETPAEPSENLKSMRIKDLLRMSTGHENDATDRMRQSGDDWINGFLSLEVEHKPGTHFVYNSAGTFMLSAIVQKVTGQTVTDYLTPRLFEPLGIDKPIWDKNPQGIDIGGWGLKLKTNDIAKFGQLLLQKGNWEGEQIVPAEWVTEATALQTSNGSSPNSDWDQGYGYQFWRCRHNLYRGDGAFGQYCIVMPEQNAVVAITSGTSDMQAIMNLVWDYLLPAMKDEALPEDSAAYNTLKEKLGSLKMSSVSGEKTSPMQESVGGKTWMLSENSMGLSSLSIDFTDTPVLTMTKDGIQESIVVGYESNELGEVSGPGPNKRKIASSGAWVKEDTWQVKNIFYQTPFSYTLIFKFSTDKLEITQQANIGFGNNQQEVIVGVLE